MTEREALIDLALPEVQRKIYKHLSAPIPAWEFFPEVPLKELITISGAGAAKTSVAIQRLIKKGLVRKCAKATYTVRYTR